MMKKHQKLYQQLEKPLTPQDEGRAEAIKDTVEQQKSKETQEKLDDLQKKVDKD